MNKQQTRKEIIERSSLLLEKYCEGCLVKGTIAKNHGNDKAQNYCLQLCKYGKEIADLGIKLQMPLKAGGAVLLTKETLATCIEQQLSWPQMENVFNYSRQTLQRKGREWGLHIPRIRKQPVNALSKYLTLRKQGKTLEQIAPEMGVCTRTLVYWRKGWGVD